MTEVDLDFAVKRLRLEPGDIVVVRSARPPSAVQVDRLRAFLSNAIEGLGVKVVVLDPGMSLSVLGTNGVERDLSLDPAA
jgi:hypothetical protein